MPGRGVLFALDAADDGRLRALADARARVSWVAGEIEERWDEAWLHQTHELWFPVHFCLSGSHDFPAAGMPPEAKAIFGGLALGIRGTYTIDYKDRALTRGIASGLSHMREDAVWARATLIERAEYDGAKGIEVQSDTVHEIHALRDFYAKAAGAGRSVIFTVDM